MKKTQVPSRMRSKRARLYGVTPLPPLKLSIATYSHSLYCVLSQELLITAMSFTRFDTARKIKEANIKHSKYYVEHRVIDLYQPFSWHYAYTFVKKYKPRITHFNVFIPLAQFPFYSLMKKTQKQGARTFVSYHNLLPHEPLPIDKLLMWKYFQATDVFMVHTGFQEKQLVKLGFPKERLLQTPFFHIYDTIFKAMNEELQIRKTNGKIVISFFGLIREYKGLDLLLDAIPSLGKEIALLIMGMPIGMYGAKIKKKVKILREQGYDIRATFEFVSDKELLEGILSSDLVVLPYRRFSSLSGIGKLCEVLGIPTISTRVPGLTDLRSNIQVCEPNVEGLKNALLKALDHRKHEEKRPHDKIRKAMIEVEKIKHEFLKDFTSHIEE